jgi:hypothetical protein
LLSEFQKKRAAKDPFDGYFASLLAPRLAFPECVPIIKAKQPDSPPYVPPIARDSPVQSPKRTFEESTIVLDDDADIVHPSKRGRKNKRNKRVAVEGDEDYHPDQENQNTGAEEEIFHVERLLKKRMRDVSCFASLTLLTCHRVDPNTLCAGLDLDQMKILGNLVSSFQLCLPFLKAF